MSGVSFDFATTLAGLLVLASFLMLYQLRVPALLNMLAVQAVFLALAVAWQGYLQDAPLLYVTAVITLAFKAVVVPTLLRRMVVRFGMRRDIQSTIGTGLSLVAGIGLVGLSLEVMLPATAHAGKATRESIALALSVVLLGMLMLVTRRDAASRIAGFLSLGNGIDLAALAAPHTPMVAEVSIGFSVLIAFLVIGLLLLRIRERSGRVDARAFHQLWSQGP